MTSGDIELDGTHAVLLHERDQVDCELLADHLSGWPYLEIAGCSVSVERSLELVKADGPDLVVAHVDAPDDGILRLALELRARAADVDLVVFGLQPDPETVLEYLEAGATACLPEAAGLEELDATLRAVLARRAHLDPEVAYRAIRRLAELAEICRQSGLEVGRLERLTPREREILGLLGQRLSNREIADRLYIEVGTVKNHVHAILDKLEVSTRQDAARYLLLARDQDES